MDSVQKSIQAMKNGEMVILVDDEDREGGETSFAPPIR